MFFWWFSTSTFWSFDWRKWQTEQFVVKSIPWKNGNRYFRVFFSTLMPVLKKTSDILLVNGLDSSMFYCTAHRIFFSAYSAAIPIFHSNTFHLIFYELLACLPLYTVLWAYLSCCFTSLYFIVPSFLILLTLLLNFFDEEFENVQKKTCLCHIGNQGIALKEREKKGSKHKQVETTT